MYWIGVPTVETIDMTTNQRIIDILHSFAHRTDVERIDEAVHALQQFGEEVVHSLAEALSDDDDYVRLIALEVLGILLTAVMIGAMVTARPLVGRPDSENYATKLDKDELDALAETSDVERNMGGSS